MKTENLCCWRNPETNKRVGVERHQYLTAIWRRNLLKFWRFLYSAQNFSLFLKKAHHVF